MSEVVQQEVEIDQTQDPNAGHDDVKISYWSSFPFKLNPLHMRTPRGILNLVQVLLGIVSMSIIAFYCRFIIPPYMNIGFVCGHPDTYFFVVCSSCLVSSFLQLSSCLLSLETSILLSRTLFELLHYLVCFVLYFTSSVALLVNLVQRNKGYVEKEDGYDGTIAAVSLGLINCCMYGGSAAWFFINRKSTS